MKISAGLWVTLVIKRKVLSELYDEVVMCCCWCRCSTVLRSGVSRAVVRRWLTDRSLLMASGLNGRLGPTAVVAVVPEYHSLNVTATTHSELWLIDSSIDWNSSVLSTRFFSSFGEDRFSFLMFSCPLLSKIYSRTVEQLAKYAALAFSVTLKVVAKGW